MTKLTIEQIKALPTKRVLAYYKKYGHSWVAKYYCESCGEFLCEYKHDIEKLKIAHDEEEMYWAKVKDELNTREHVHK